MPIEHGGWDCSWLIKVSEGEGNGGRGERKEERKIFHWSQKKKKVRRTESLIPDSPRARWCASWMKNLSSASTLPIPSYVRPYLSHSRPSVVALALFSFPGVAKERRSFAEQLTIKFDGEMPWCGWFDRDLFRGWIERLYRHFHPRRRDVNTITYRDALARGNLMSRKHWAYAPFTRLWSNWLLFKIMDFSLKPTSLISSVIISLVLFLIIYTLLLRDFLNFLSDSQLYPTFMCLKKIFANIFLEIILIRLHKRKTNARAFRVVIALAVNSAISRD